MGIIDSPARGENSIAGVISKPVKVILSLTVRDDVQQTEQFSLHAAAGCHDGGEKCLGAVRAIGTAIVIPVSQDLRRCGHDHHDHRSGDDHKRTFDREQEQGLEEASL